MTSAQDSKRLSNLDIVEKCDSFPDHTLHPVHYREKTARYSRFMYLSRTLSYVIPSVVEVLRDTKLSGQWWDIGNGTVSLKGDTPEERTKNIQQTLKNWKDASKFQVLQGWRDELYTVYASTGKGAFQVERCGCSLFGFVTYGAHMTAYIPATPSQPLRLWIPQRAGGKSTYPSMLDNTVAGGMGNGITAYDCIVKEAGEEASLSPEFVKERVKSVGFVSYFYERSADAGGEVGLLQPEVEYVFDLEMPEDVIPKPCDDEVAKHMLMTVDEVRDNMSKGRFKPNCALVLLDFFIRHGIITAANEPDYIEIYTRIHRRLEFPMA